MESKSQPWSAVGPSWSSTVAEDSHSRPTGQRRRVTPANWRPVVLMYPADPFQDSKCLPLQQFWLEVVIVSAPISRQAFSRGSLPRWTLKCSPSLLRALLPRAWAWSSKRSSPPLLQGPGLRCPVVWVYNRLQLVVITRHVEDTRKPKHRKHQQTWCSLLVKAMLSRDGLRNLYQCAQDSLALQPVSVTRLDGGRRQCLSLHFSCHFLLRRQHSMPGHPQSSKVRSRCGVLSRGWGLVRRQAIRPKASRRPCTQGTRPQASHQRHQQSVPHAGRRPPKLQRHFHKHSSRTGLAKGAILLGVAKTMGPNAVDTVGKTHMHDASVHAKNRRASSDGPGREGHAPGAAAAVLQQAAAAASRERIKVDDMVTKSIKPGARRPSCSRGGGVSAPCRVRSPPKVLLGMEGGRHPARGPGPMRPSPQFCHRALVRALHTRRVMGK